LIVFSFQLIADGSKLPIANWQLPTSNFQLAILN